MEAPGFWDDPSRSNKLMKELKGLKDTRQTYQDLETQFQDILTLIEIGYEENDESLIPEVRQELESFESVFEEIRISTLLSGEYDKNNAILKLNAGAGGTESCDWCSMSLALSAVTLLSGGMICSAVRLCAGMGAGNPARAGRSHIAGA